MSANKGFNRKHWRGGQDRHLYPIPPKDGRIFYIAIHLPRNPGNGVFYWAEVSQVGNLLAEFGCRVSSITNNRMEVLGLIDIIEKHKECNNFVVYSSSQYLVNGVNAWMFKWKKKNFSKIKNPDLWSKLYSALLGKKITMRWVKSLSGNKWNDYTYIKAMEMYYDS